MSVAYYSIYNLYRNATYLDSVAINIGTAIKFAEKEVAGEKINAGQYLLLGSAYAVQSLYSSVNGDWSRAFIEGIRMCSCRALVNWSENNWSDPGTHDNSAPGNNGDTNMNVVIIPTPGALPANLQILPLGESSCRTKADC
jgi:hypothetical protein